MTETTTQLSEQDIDAIEARLKVVYAKWHEPGFIKRLLDQDIPALIREVRALRAENDRLQRQYEAAVADFAVEINALREQLAEAQSRILELETEHDTKAGYL